MKTVIHRPKLIHFHSKYLTKIIKKMHYPNHFKRLAQKKKLENCAVAIFKTVP